MKRKVKVLVTQLCLTLYDPMDYSPTDSSVHGILQVKILEWVAIPFSRDLPNPVTASGSPLLWTDSLLSEPQGSLNLKKGQWKSPNLRKRNKKDCGKVNRPYRTCGIPRSRPTHALWKPQREKRKSKKTVERIFEEIMAENVPNLMKDMNINIQEAQQMPSRMNLKKSMPRHIIIKLSTAKDIDF